MHRTRTFPFFSFAYDPTPSPAALQELRDAIPKPANQMPKSEAGRATMGEQQTRFALEDHQHARLTSATPHQLDANGLVTVEFTRQFDRDPAIIVTALDANGGPVPDFSAVYVRNAAGVVTGAIIYGERKKPLPLLTGILLIGPIVTALAGFKPWEAAAGAKVSVVAIANSSPA